MIYQQPRAYRSSPGQPDLGRLAGVVASEILDAMHAADAELDRLGIRHLLIGGLAVGAWGYPRASRDVDFLVTDNAFEHHAGGIITFAPGVPITIGGVAVDYQSPQPGEEHLQAELASAASVISLEALIYMKLSAGRRQDIADVAALLDAQAASRAVVREYLARLAPQLLPALDAL